MTHLDLVIAEIRAEIATASDHVRLAGRRAGALPSISVDETPWGERRQRLDAALVRAARALLDAREALDP